MKKVNNVSISSWKFPHIFFVCRLQKPLGHHWFKKVLFELFSLSFFIKWWNSTNPFFFCMSEQYYCQTFFLTKIKQKYIWSTEMYFYGCCQIVWLLTGTPLNFILFYKKIMYIHIINQYCIATNFSQCFLEEFHLVLLLATTWRPNLEKDLTIWMFTIWESLFSDHKSESWIPCHIYLCCNLFIYLVTVFMLFQKFCCLKKTTKDILFPQKCFVFAGQC